MRSQALRSANVMRTGFAALVVALCATGASAQGPAVFREVRLDLSGLPVGATETRQTIAACLSQNLPVAFAGRVNPGARGAPVLVVRPTSVWLAPPGNVSGDDRASSRSELSSPDFMEGEALIGQTRIPLQVSGGGEYPSPIAPLQQANRRTIQLCQSFAYWLARKV
jgi:hypothetical protein